MVATSDLTASRESDIFKNHGIIKMPSSPSTSPGLPRDLVTIASQKKTLTMPRYTRPYGEFVDRLVIAFERCLRKAIQKNNGDSVTLRTFVPIARNVERNMYNNCWCPEALEREERHSSYHCPFRPIWKMGENLRFRPCRHLPAQTPQCGRCLDVSRIALDFVNYAGDQDLTEDPPDPDLDIDFLELAIGALNGYEGGFQRAPNNHLPVLLSQRALVAHLVWLARNQDMCRFATHLDPKIDACLVHAILRWNEQRTMNTVDGLLREFE
jgi:hypothetical protein